MCDLTTILMVAGTATSTIGALQQGRAEAQAAQMQAQVAQNNMMLVNEQIADASRRGKDEMQRVQVEGAKASATSRAALAANGVDVGFGSPLDTITEAIIESQRDAYRVRRNTAYEIADLQTQRSNFQLGASAAAASARNAMTGGVLAGVGTALDGAGDVLRYRAKLQAGGD